MRDIFLFYLKFTFVVLITYGEIQNKQKQYHKLTGFTKRILK
jgi:hypothetical protein